MKGSETFIRNQVDSIEPADVGLFGLVRERSSLSRETDWLLFDGDSRFVRFRARLFRLTGRSRRVENEFQARNVTMIHAHFARDGLSIMRVARRLSIPLAVTFHGYDVTEAPHSRFARSIWHWRRRILFKRADRLIAVSNFIRDMLLSLGAPSEKIDVLPIGIPVHRSIESHKRSGVLFVGRLTEKKGVPDLIRAIERAETEIGPVPLTIVGDGHLRDSLESLASARLHDVSFLGARSPEQIFGLMLRASVFCAPSKTARSGDSEGFGMVFLEAADAALPVVAYAHGGVPEAVEDGRTGLLVKEGDVDALARAICELVTHDSVARGLGAAGRERVLRDFDVRRRSQDLSDMYRNLLGNRDQRLNGVVGL